MRILMLSPYIPWPPHGGGAIRIYNVLKQLRRRGHQIFLLAGQEGLARPVGPEVKAVCDEVHLFDLPSMSRAGLYLRSLFSLRPYPALKFRSAQLARQSTALSEGRPFDLVWINFEVVADSLPPGIFKNTVAVLEEHESQEMVWRTHLEHGNLGQRFFAWSNLVKLRRFQERILAHVTAVLSVSDVEAKLMRRRVPRGVEVWTVPNGVDVEFFRPTPFSLKESNRIILTGNMSVRRNAEAAARFARYIFPRVRSILPDAQFWIVGASPAREVLRLKNEAGVQVTGTVEDVREHFAKARVCVSPYRYGAGTKLKVLEAMASGVPVVSTVEGCRGLDVKDGEHLVMAKNESDFSQGVVELLQNPQRAQRLATAARKLAEDKYRWETIIDDLEPKLDELVRQRSTSARLDGSRATLEPTARTQKD